MPRDPTTAVAAAEVDGPAEEGPPPASQRRRSRWRKWIVLLLVLLTIRLALPIIAAPYLAARLSRTLGTEVDIADLSFQPIDAILTLRGVTVHAPPGSPTDTTPPIVARRVHVDVQWLPLFHRQLQIRELALESARVDLDRFADGRFGLADLERTDPASALPAGWSLGLDRIVWRDSTLRVRDLAAGDRDLIEATLRNASISGIRRRATAFGKAPNLYVDAVVGGGQVRVRGRYELRDDGLVLDAVLRVKDVPLAQAKGYVADLGWTDLAGQVSGQLRWQREPRRRDLLSGRVIVRRGRVRVADLAEPALAVRRGIAEIGAIDLLARRIAIRTLTLRGATVAFQPEGAAPIPLLATVPSRASFAAPTGAERNTGGAAGSRWNWMIERYETIDGRLRILAPGGHLDLRAQAAGENLGPDAYWSPLRIHARRGDTIAAFDGTVRLHRGVTIEGRLTAGGIDLPSLARAAAIPWADLVQAGRATADLTVQLDTTTPDASPLFFRGAFTCTDVWVAGPDASMFAFGTPAIDLTLERYHPREPARADGRGGAPPRLMFSEAQISAPYILLTRTPDGWILPPFVPSTDAAATVTPAPEPEEESAAITLRNVRLGSGRVIVVDLVPASTVRWELTRAEGTAQRLALPGFTFDSVHLNAVDHRFGPLQLSGSRAAEDLRFELAGDDVPLVAITPYLRLAGLPYSFASGNGSFIAQGDIHPSQWSAAAEVSLRDAALIGSDALQMTIGMPLNSALAMLRDASGGVPVRLALASPHTGGRTLADQVAAGIRDTLRGLAEVAPTGRHEGGALPMATVPFAPGQVQLTLSGMEAIAPVAKLIGSRPGLVAELSAETSQQDRRWLAEQALLPRLDDGGGFRSVLRALGVQDARARIRTALAARRRGAPGLLDDDDEAMLTRLLTEAPPVAEREVAGLRDGRLMRVANHLDEYYGISGNRVIFQRATARDTGPLATVRVQVAIGRDTATAPPQHID